MTAMTCKTRRWKSKTKCGIFFFFYILERLRQFANTCRYAWGHCHLSLMTSINSNENWNDFGSESYGEFLCHSLLFIPATEICHSESSCVFICDGGKFVNISYASAKLFLRSLSSTLEFHIDRLCQWESINTNRSIASFRNECWILIFQVHIRN